MAGRGLITVKITGVTQVMKRLGWSAKDTQQVAKSLRLVADDILKEADSTVPVKYGNLKASGEATGPISTQFGSGATVTVKYGGLPARGQSFPEPSVVPNGVDYAVTVHEVTAKSGLLKWLEIAFRNHVKDIRPAVEKAVMRVFSSRP